MGTIRESIESAFVAVAFAERNRSDEAVWQLRGGDDDARQHHHGARTTPSTESPTSGAQTRTATAGQRQRPVLRAE